MPFRSRLSVTTVSSSRNEESNKHSHAPYAEKFNSTDIALTPLTPNTADVDDSTLPPPVTQALSLSSGRRSKQKKIRIESNARGSLHVHWDRLLRKMRNGTAPSTSSALEGSTVESSGYKGSRGAPETEDDTVDDVVVDREWGDELSNGTHSDHGASPEKSGGSNHLGGTNTDRESLAIYTEGFWACCALTLYLRYRLWPVVFEFFTTRFMDEKSEAHYNKENWFLRKNLAIWSSLFYILNWLLTVIFVPRPAVLPDTIFYYGIATALTFPIFIMVVYDFPRDRPAIYQTTLLCSTWMWGIYQVIFIRLCGFYVPDKPWLKLYDCGGKDFLSTFYYTSALQTIALFGLKLHRFPAMIGVVCFFALMCGLIVPERTQWSRYVLNFVFFQGFLLYVHYMRENAERRLYTLRDQLKIQFRATQKAQVNERKAADSKRRLTSYVFHEVRVPLNTALLAVQNMDASGTVAKAQEIEFKALEGSLNMMSKVLNDVLDFNRMDSGRFESVLKPYSFHKVMRSLFVPLQLATDSRGLSFITDLDKSIDEVARQALYEAMGASEDEIKKKMETDEDGIVVGDETRLRQIITNLASNACKFTSAGGQLTISTKLIIPGRRQAATADSETIAEVPRDKRESPPTPDPNIFADPTSTTPSSDGLHLQLSANHLSRHNDIHSKPPPLEWIAVRIEVTDTGCGIRRKDMIQSKLFSAFNQTEMGRQQGGKGTGLGLALVRQIVKLSGGRLGVRSKINEGSTFWVELPLGVGTKAIPGIKSKETPESFLDMSDLGLPSFSHFQDTPDEHMMEPSKPPVRNSSALHSIMEQGGLVEISTKRNEQDTVLTRTIGDPSTGTDPLTPGVLGDPSPVATPSELAAPPISGKRQIVDENGKPRILELPERPVFTSDRPPLAGTSPATTSSSTVVAKSILASSPPAASSEEAMRVLVVDDDPLTRKLMSRMLTRLGCKVSTAENGEHALEMILGLNTRVTPSSEETGSGGLSADVSGPITPPTAGNEESKYAVVFLDNQMPVMSGLELVGKLRELGRDDFVVGVTGNALLTDQQEYYEAGVDHVLTKPVYEKSLRAMLAKADELRRRQSGPSENPRSTTSPFASP